MGDESESDDEEDKEETDRKSPSQHTKSSDPVTEGWGSTFGKVDEDSWKCDACMLHNKGSATMCTACETPKPGCEGNANNATDGDGVGAGTVAPTASIGAGGFSFGGSSTSGSIGAGGFSFGGTTTSSPFGSTPASAAPVETGTQGGLSFGGVSVPAPAPSTGGFSFATKENSSVDGDKATASGGGFSFASEKPSKKEDLKKVDTGSYPPISLSAPSPFSAKAAAKPAALSSGYPPIASKAPTPFGGTEAATNTPPAYPPLASKAPTPFDAFGAKAAAKPAALSSGYPPIASKAPTPFGGTKTATNTPPAYPPLASKAPTPFDAFGAKAAAKPAAISSGYPPIASKAPTPFGGTKAATNTPPAYPPLASKAPTPFGAFGAKAAAKPAALSSGYPPIASKAPTPFGVSKVATNTPPAYPPLALKAPTPFGGIITKTDSSARPQISSTAPFDAKPAALSSGYPPIASKAPTPFGSTKSEDRPILKAPTAYPPIASTAPTPFIGSGKLAAPAPSGYPPLSSNAPTPFSSSVSQAEPRPSFGSISTNYPPISSTAPTPFGGLTKKPSASKAPIPVNAISNTNTFSVNSPASNPLRKSATNTASSTLSKLESPKEKEYIASSEYEARLWDVVQNMRRVQEEISSRTKQSHNDDEKNNCFVNDISKLVETLEKLKAYARKLSSNLEEQKDGGILLLSRKVDIQRQTAESRRLIDQQTGTRDRNVSHADTARKQPLDAESENTRRSLASKATGTQRAIATAQDRLRLMQRMFEHEKLRSGDTHFSTHLTQTSMARHPGDDDSARRTANVTLFNSLKKEFDLTRQFETESSSIEKKVKDLAEKKVKVESFKAGKRDDVDTDRLFLSPAKRGYGPRLKPVPLSFSSPLDAKHKARSLALTSVTDESEIRSQVQSAARCIMGSLNACPVTWIPCRPRFDEKPSVQSLGVPQKWRQAGGSQLMSPADSIPGKRSSHVYETLSPSAKPTFSTPSISLRSDWKIVSSGKLSFPIPKNVKEVHASSVAEGALARYGTTPEKVTNASKTRERGEKKKPALQQPVPATKATAAFPPMSKKAPTPFSSSAKPPTKENASSSGSVPLKSTSSAAFPPMSKEAPTPFSQAPKPKSVQENSSSSGFAFASSVSSFGTGMKSSEPSSDVAKESTSHQPPSADAKKEDEKDIKKSRDGLGFGGFSGFGDALSSVSAAPSEKKPSSSAVSKESEFGAAPFSSPFPTSSASSTNFHSILTKFYQKHNPSKVGEVEKTLVKYKGKEAEMFAKLATKYKVPNPLSEGASGFSSTPSGANHSSFGGGSTTQTALGQTSTVPSASPFSANRELSTAPTQSPFMTGSPSLRPSAAIPPSSPSWGAATNAPNVQPAFGSTSNMPSSSPFGQSAVPNTGATVFGGSGAGATPFGSPPVSSGFGVGSSQSSDPNKKFGGRTPREMLVAVYQQYNPAKVSEVDKLLAKYKNKEEHLFINLAKKYNLDPSMFGVSHAPAAQATPAFGPPSTGAASSGFGQPSTFGQNAGGFGGGMTPAPSPFGAPASTGFGKSSTLGASSTFGSPSAMGGSAFGSTSTPGGGFGSFATAGATPGFGGSGGFGTSAPATTGTGFGSQASSGFGSMANPPTSGGGFGSGAASTGGFGNAGTSPFGAARR
eukprot:scaffold207977_cov55-Attheya_sp.AAC.1